MPINFSFRLAVLSCCIGFLASSNSAVSIATPQDFQFDENGNNVAYTSCERHDLTVLCYKENTVVFRSTIADFFRENSWSPLNSINPIPGPSFTQLSLHPGGEFVAFRAVGNGMGSCYSGIFNVKFERPIGLHFGGVKTFEFSPDGKWLITSEIGGISLMPFREYPNFRAVLPTESSSYYFSQDCKKLAMCTYIDVPNVKQITEIQIFCLPDEAEVVKQIQNTAKVELELLKHFRYEGHAKDLRFSPDNKWLMWKGNGTKPFIARIDLNDAKIQAIEFEDEFEFYGDVCFAGTASDYFIIAQKSGEVDARYRVNLWKQSMDLESPAEQVFSKPGSCSYPIEINLAGTHALVAIDIIADVTGGHGHYSEAEAALLGGSQVFLLELSSLKVVHAFPQNAQNNRRFKFHPKNSIVVVREGDRFSEYDLAGNPVAKSELTKPPESRTKR